MKDNVFLINIIERRINCYKGRGQPRKTFISEMIKLTGGDNYFDIKKLAKEGENDKKMFCNNKTRFWVLVISTLDIKSPYSLFICIK